MAEELDALKRAGAVAVHLDVMDGHFVPNLSYGAPVIADWRQADRFPVRHPPDDLRPARYLDDFVRAGCDVIIFHIEVVPEPVPLLRRIRAAGCQAALGLNPPTPFSAIEPYLDEVDAVLVMSVMPGFGGQKFEAAVLDKVRAAAGGAARAADLDRRRDQARRPRARPWRPGRRSWSPARRSSATMATTRRPWPSWPQAARRGSA